MSAFGGSINAILGVTPLPNSAPATYILRERGSSHNDWVTNHPTLPHNDDQVLHHEPLKIVEINPVPLPDITNSKKLADPATGIALVSDTITFTIWFTNSGQTDISSLGVTDTYDQIYLTLTSWSLMPDAHDPVQGIITWTNGLAGPPAWPAGFLPLQDVYSTTYMTYGYTDTSGVGTFASPDSDDHHNDGVIDWSDLKASEGDLSPNDSVTVIVTFTAKADTHHVGLPNDETEDTATAHDVRADPDGPGGPLPEETLPAESATDGVEIEFPTGVVLASLNGVALPDGVLVTWQTAGESGILGFNVLRREADGEFGMVNEEFIFAEYAGSDQGTSHDFRDEEVVSGANYDYVLEVVQSDGRVGRQGHASVSVGWWFRLPLVM